MLEIYEFINSPMANGCSTSCYLSWHHALTASPMANACSTSCYLSWHHAHTASPMANACSTSCYLSWHHAHTASPMANRCSTSCYLSWRHAHTAIEYKTVKRKYFTSIFMLFILNNKDLVTNYCIYYKHWHPHEMDYIRYIIRLLILCIYSENLWNTT